MPIGEKTTKENMLKAQEVLRKRIGEEAYLIEIKRRASKGGSVRSDAKKLAAKMREQRKREARQG